MGTTVGALTGSGVRVGGAFGLLPSTLGVFFGHFHKGFLEAFHQDLAGGNMIVNVVIDDPPKLTLRSVIRISIFV